MVFCRGLSFLDKKADISEKDEDTRSSSEAEDALGGLQTPSSVSSMEGE